MESCLPTIVSNHIQPLVEPDIMSSATVAIMLCIRKIKTDTNIRHVITYVIIQAARAPHFTITAAQE
jgi:hypothetical protein